MRADGSAWLVAPLPYEQAGQLVRVYQQAPDDPATRRAATATQVRALVVRQAAGVLGTGLVTGIAGAVMLGRWLSSLVFEVSPWDPRILLTTAVLLTITGLFSAWLPARRASRIDPRSAMQHGH
jgi:hypothetical protein